MFDLTCNQYQFNRPVDFADLIDDASPITLKIQDKKRKKQEDEFTEFETKKIEEERKHAKYTMGGKLKNKKTKINKKNKKTKKNKKHKKTKKKY